MVRRILWLILDALVPPADEVLITRALSAHDVVALFKPRSLLTDSWVTALFPYASFKIRAVVKAIKFRGEPVPEIIAKLLADEVLAMLDERRLHGGWHEPRLVPIPSSAARLRARGYNQSLRIAEAVNTHLPGFSVMNALTRDERPSQVSIPKSERLTNVAGSMRVIDSTVRGAYIVLIDDVVETGSTMEEARRALIEGGAAGILGIAIAH